MSDLTNKIKLLITGLNEDLGTVSKLYSTGIPNNATGDMVVSRTADTATRVNSTGNIETVVANKARITYELGVDQCPNLLVEKTRFNAAQNSGDTTNLSHWSLGSAFLGSLPVTVMGHTFVDLVAVASSDIGVGAGRTGGGCITTSLTNGLRYTISFYYKKTGGTNNSANYYVLIGGLDIAAGFNIDDNTSFIIYDSAATTGRVRTITQIGNTDVYLCEESFTMTATANVTNLFLSLAGYASNTFPIGARGAVGLPQIEQGAFATSRIITTGVVAVTANADVISKTGLSALIPQTKGAICFDGYLQAGSLGDGLIREGYSIYENTINYLSIARYNNSFVFIVYNAGVQIVGISSSIIAPIKDKRVKVVATYENDYYSFYVNGTLISSDISGTVPSISKIAIGSLAGTTEYWDGLIKAVAVTDELTLAEIEQLSSYSSFENMAEQMIYQMI